MRILAILNPISGNRDTEFLKQELYKAFDGHDFEMHETTQALEAINISRKAAENNFDIVIAAGGDGTIIEVISGIIGTKTKLGIIPYGTGNMLAGNLGIPVNNLTRAIEIILEGSSTPIDIGKINDKYFAFMAGCGFDAKIIDETSREKKKRLGLLAYYIEGVMQFFRSKYALFKIRLDNNKIIKTRALTVIIANSAGILGNMASLAPQASLNDGLLDVIIISPKGISGTLQVLWEIIFRTPRDTRSKIRHYQAKDIEIKSKPSLLVQADGDIIGKTPVKIQILPGAIEVLAPEQPKNELLQIAEDHLRKMIDLASDYIKINIS